MPRHQSPRRKRSRRSKTKRRSPKRSLRRRRYRSSSSRLDQPRLSPMAKILQAKSETTREMKDEVTRRRRIQELAADKAKERAQRRLVSGETSSQPTTVASNDIIFKTPFIHGSDGRHILPFFRNDQLLAYKMGKDGNELYSVEIVLESDGGPFMFTPLTEWTPTEWRPIDTTTPLAEEQILDPTNPAGVHLFDMGERLVPGWGRVSSFVKDVTRTTSTTFTYIVGMDTPVEYTVSPMVLINSLNDDNDDQIFHMALLHRKTPSGGVSVISFSAEKGFGYKLSLAEETMPHLSDMGPTGTRQILAASSEQSSPLRRKSPMTMSFTRRQSKVKDFGPASARV